MGSIEQTTKANAFIDGVWRLEFSAGAVRHEGLLYMKGAEGALIVQYFNSATNNTERVSQVMRLWSSSQGLILKGYNPLDPSTKMPHPNYAPDEFLFQRRPDGKMYVRNCDSAGNCSPVRVEFISKKLN